MVQVSKRLVIKKEVPIDNSKDLVNSLDVAMAEYYCKNIIARIRILKKVCKRIEKYCHYCKIKNIIQRLIYILIIH